MSGARLEFGGEGHADHHEVFLCALARAGYDFRDLRNLGFTARLLERSGVRQSQET